MHNEEWSGPRVAAVLTALRDAGIPEARLARMGGVSQSTVNRWTRGKVQPGYRPVRQLAAALYRSYPDLARALVEASGYAWAEPGEASAPDVLAEAWGEDTAERVRREVRKRAPAEAEAILAGIEDIIRRSGEEARSDAS